MDLSRFVTLQTVVEEGSFARAAHRLCCTQSTISFQVKQLEQELSTRLFEKIGRRMVLTEAGKTVLPMVRELTQTLDAMHRSLHPGEVGGELRIVIGETLLAYRMPSILQRFHALAPNVKLSLHSLNCYAIRDMLAAGKADLGVFYHVGDDTILTMHDLGIFPVTLVASPQLSDVDFTRPNQRLPISLIINEAQCVYRLTFEQSLRQRNIVLGNTIELWSIESIKKCVSGNLGVTYLPQFCVEQELQDGTLQELRFHSRPETLRAVCAHHTNKDLTPAAQLLLNLLQEGI